MCCTLSMGMALLLCTQGPTGQSTIITTGYRYVQYVHYAIETYTLIYYLYMLHPLVIKQKSHSAACMGKITVSHIYSQLWCFFSDSWMLYCGNVVPLIDDTHILYYHMTWMKLCQDWWNIAIFKCWLFHCQNIVCATFLLPRLELIELTGSLA